MNTETECCPSAPAPQLHTNNPNQVMGQASNKRISHLPSRSFGKEAKYAEIVNGDDDDDDDIDNISNGEWSDDGFG